MTERIELLAYNVHTETRVGGELRREVREAAGNRVGGRGGTARDGEGERVDRAGGFYEFARFSSFGQCLAPTLGGASLNSSRIAFEVRQFLHWMGANLCCT